MENLGVYPAEAVVKVGDTIPDIESGLNAGCFTIGVAKTGNMIGMNLEELNNTESDELQKFNRKAYDNMYNAGAHLVVDGVEDSLEAVIRFSENNCSK